MEMPFSFSSAMDLAVGDGVYMWLVIGESERMVIQIHPLMTERYSES